MRRRSRTKGDLTPAQRGRIVQCVIIEGWSSAETAAAFGLHERLVAAWVADYRRHGMASLRDRPGKTVAAEIIRLHVSRPLHGLWRGTARAMRWLLDCRPPPAAITEPLRRLHDDHHGGS
ncbi:MAG: helix-turn-helix domain-containing protein [Stellaceae bacterium]